MLPNGQLLKSHRNSQLGFSGSCRSGGYSIMAAFSRMTRDCSWSSASLIVEWNHSRRQIEHTIDTVPFYLSLLPPPPPYAELYLDRIERRGNSFVVHRKLDSEANNYLISIQILIRNTVLVDDTSCRLLPYFFTFFSKLRLQHIRFTCRTVLLRVQRCRSRFLLIKWSSWIQ